MSSKKSAGSSSAHNRRKRRNRAHALLILVVVIVAAVVVIALLIRHRSRVAEAGDSLYTETEADSADDENESDDILPEIEDTDSLTLSSVYTSSILNPDCGGEYAEEIASLEVTNSSDQYLLSAELTAVMSDGTEVIFSISDLPAGDTAEIFDTGNQTLAEDVTCTSLVCTSEEYLDEDVLMSDTIEVRADGSDAVIANTGGSDLTELTVVYHCDMAGQYFGGASYTIKIDYLAAGESYTLSDSTLMGEAAVVRVYQ